MKRIRTSILVVFFFLGMIHAQAQVLNDEVGYLTPDEINKLEKKISAYEDSTSNEIAIFLIKSLEGEHIREYAIRIAKEKGVGQRGKDNGLVLVFSERDKKCVIEVGYGLESRITDTEAKAILDEIIIPGFKKKNYFQTLDKAIDRMIQLSSGEFKNDGIVKAKPFEIDYFEVLSIFSISSLLIGGLFWFFRRRQKVAKVKAYQAEVSILLNDAAKWRKLKEFYKEEEVDLLEESLQNEFYNANTAEQLFEIEEKLKKIYLEDQASKSSLPEIHPYLTLKD